MAKPVTPSARAPLADWVAWIDWAAPLGGVAQVVEVAEFVRWPDRELAAASAMVRMTIKAKSEARRSKASEGQSVQADLFGGRGRGDE